MEQTIIITKTNERQFFEKRKKNEKKNEEEETLARSCHKTCISPHQATKRGTKIPFTRDSGTKRSGGNSLSPESPVGDTDTTGVW